MFEFHDRGTARATHWCGIGLLLLLLGACAQVDARPDFERTQALIRESTGQREVFSPEQQLLAPGEIAAILADGLGLDEALRLALRNNRRLQMGFMRIGGARAGVVQAGLWSNPTLSLAFLFPSGGGDGKFTADIGKNISELWQLGPRERAAEQSLEREVFDVARAAGELVAGTKEAYYEAVAAGAAVRLARESHEVAQRSVDAVKVQLDAGAATRVDESLARVALLGAELALAQAVRRDGDARRSLAALLSLEDDIAGVALADAMPEPSLHTLVTEQVVRRTVEQRLDLRAAAAAVEAADATLAYETKRGGFSIDAGVSLERPETRQPSLLIGPEASLTLPLFDQGQARISAARFRYLELRKAYEALRAEAQQEVRAAVDRTLRTAQEAIFVRDQLLPQAEAGARLAAASYGLGDTTLLTLLESQRSILQARATYLEQRLAAVRAGVGLERSAGAPIEQLLEPRR